LAGLAQSDSLADGHDAVAASYATRLSMMIGRCLRPSWYSTTSCRLSPGLTGTFAWGEAQGTGSASKRWARIVVDGRRRVCVGSVPPAFGRPHVNISLPVTPPPVFARPDGASFALASQSTGLTTRTRRGRLPRRSAAKPGACDRLSAASFALASQSTGLTTRIRRGRLPRQSPNTIPVVPDEPAAGADTSSPPPVFPAPVLCARRGKRPGYSSIGAGSKSLRLTQPARTFSPLV